MSELAVLAREGDPAALAALLAEHRAGMLKVALSLLRQPDDAEDAVQDAALTALSRIGELRDPASAGAWLRMIVRNICRMRLRRAPVISLEALAPMPATTGDPQEAIDRHAMRDSVWHALGELPGPLRTVAMLRYFSATTRYDEIAALAGIPVGTVRSRLHQARRLLADGLLSAGRAYDGASAIVAARQREAEQAVDAGHAGTFAELLRDGWRADVDAVWADGRRLRGTDAIARHMDASMAAGIRQRVAGVAAGPGVTIWEMDVTNPSGIGRPCPAYTLWLLSYEKGRVSDLRLFSRS